MAAEEKGITLTMGDLERLLSKMQGEQAKSLIEAIRELKKPSDEELAAKAEKAAKDKKNREEMLRLGDEEIANRKKIQAACRHRKPNGEMNWKGQVHGDGPNAVVRLICGICMKELINRPATTADVSEGPLELLPENSAYVPPRLM